jgi:pimeloyl-ACP methyl ester carboxylesterase
MSSVTGFHADDRDVGAQVRAAALGLDRLHLFGNSWGGVLAMQDWDVMDRLGEITVPTLLVGGRHDECRPAHLEDMHHRIPGSQLAIIEDVSHLRFAEQPAEFITLVDSFFDRTDGDSA